jgi:hypothetical protein
MITMALNENEVALFRFAFQKWAKIPDSDPYKYSIAVYLTKNEIRLLRHGLDLWMDEDSSIFPSPETNAGTALFHAMMEFEECEE